MRIRVVQKSAILEFFRNKSKKTGKRFETGVADNSGKLQVLAFVQVFKGKINWTTIDCNFVILHFYFSGYYTPTERPEILPNPIPSYPAA